MNCDTFTFNSFELTTSNFFNPLCDSHNHIDSFTSNSPFSPPKTSSPKDSKSYSHPHHSSRPSHHSTARSSTSSSTSKLPKKTNLRILNVNCRSVFEKQSEFAAVLDYIKPDVVCGTESWLRGEQPGENPASAQIKSSEVFPDSYNVYRNDRSSLGGGVFILVHKSLTSTEQPDLVTNCELEWVKIQLRNHKDLFVGAFYMPHRNFSDLKELQKSLNLLTDNGKKQRQTILAGDFNCPDIDWENHTQSSSGKDGEIQQNLIDITSSALLSQIHTTPTRESAILDLVFTSNPSLAKSSTSIPGISDHAMVVADFDTKPHITLSLKRKTYKFSKADWEALREDIEKGATTVVNKYNEGADVTELWTSFKTLLKSAIDRSIPSSSQKRRTSLPWLNASLKRMLRRKQRLFTRARRSGSWTTYRNFQKLCRRETRRAEWKFINGTIQEGLSNNNSKPFWSFIKSKRQDNSGVAPLKDKGQLITDSQTKANLLLKQFKSVFTKPSLKPPPPTNTPPTDPIRQLDISTPGVAKLLRELKPHKAPGPDSIPNAVLKNCADQIAPALSAIYQRSLDTGSLPPDWLAANVSCAFKKGNRHSPENYRPISLTSVPCKILEHIICRHILTHLETHNILSNLNHGFRSGFSCETQLLTTTHDLISSFDSRKQVDVAILDFSKAFDTVPHSKLLHKLKNFGITGPLHQWLSCFLTQRSMRVVLEGTSSETTSVDSGVPQGTVLAPLLFLCHINDLPNSVKSQVRLFADDCLLYREINSYQDHYTLQEDLRQLEAWAETWGMRFNARKCYILSIQNKTDFLYQLDNTFLQRVPTNPYLGVLLSEDLKWGPHIAQITKKANSTLGFLRRNLRRCPPGCKNNAYLALVRPILEYGAAVWDPYLKQDIDRIERTQRNAARFITGDFRSTTPGSVSKLLIKTNLQPLQDRRRQARLTLLYRVVEGLVPALPPDTFLTQQKPGRLIRPRRDKDFYSSNPISSYVRNNNRPYNITRCNTEQLRNSYFVRTVVDWNQLESNTVNAKSVANFKTLLAADLHQ